MYKYLQVPIIARVFQGVIFKFYWMPKGMARTLNPGRDFRLTQTLTLEIRAQVYDLNRFKPL